MVQGQRAGVTLTLAGGVQGGVGGEGRVKRGAAAGSLNALHNQCHAAYKRGECMRDNFITTYAGSMVCALCIMIILTASKCDTAVFLVPLTGTLRY